MRSIALFRLSSLHVEMSGTTMMAPRLIVVTILIFKNASYARTIVRHRNAFLEAASGCKVVNCSYESLIEDIARAGSREEIPAAPGSLWDIAHALEAPFTFRYDRRLQKAINIPYSRLLSNYDALVGQLKDSEFSNLVLTLE